MSDPLSSTTSGSSSSTPISPSPETGKPHISQVSDNDKQAAAQLKGSANQAFTSQSRCASFSFYVFLLDYTDHLLLTYKTLLAHDFLGAANLYSEAIEKNPNDATLWCNRAYARMKLEEYGYALSDASKWAIQSSIYRILQFFFSFLVLSSSTSSEARS